jgi:hypothetical protein
MELTYARYLQDEGLREELERRAHRERAQHMYRFLAESADALLHPRARLQDAKRSYVSR